MRALVFGSGDFTGFKDINEEDIIICCDGGARHVRRLGLVPHILLGDMDSIAEEDLSYYIEQGVKIQRYKEQKDETDFEIGIDYALGLKVDEIILLGAIGSRLDHSFSSITLLYKCLKKGVAAWIIDEKSRITLTDKSIRLKGDKGSILSLLPLSESVAGVTTMGLFYPLNDETLFFGSTRGNSNVFLENSAEVHLKSGLLLLVISKE